MSTKTNAALKKQDGKKEDPTGDKRILKKVEDAPNKKPVEGRTPLIPESESVTGKLERMEKLARLGERYRLLKEKDTELDTFIQGADGTNSKIILESNTGQSFVISNTDVIEITVKEVRSQLDVKLTKTKEDILTFNV